MPYFPHFPVLIGIGKVTPMNAQSANMGPLQRWLLLATVGVGITIITLDNTILYTALPSLVEDLGATSTQQLWIVNIYAIVIAGLLLGTGTLGDKIGHRRMFIAGLIIFGCASLLAAFAPSAAMLILGRALLAVGGATMMPSTLSLIRLTFTNPAELNLAIGIWGSLSTVSATLGPIVGGLLLEAYWWGSCFLVNVPLVIAALVAVPFVAPPDRANPDKHWDFSSSVYAMITLVSAVMLIKEGTHAPQNWPIIGVAAVLLVLAGWAFTRRQEGLEQPLITLDIFRYPAFRCGALGAALSMFALAGLQYVITQKLQLADGLSPLRSGVYVTFAAMGALATSIYAGARLAQFGIRRLIAGGFGVATIGAAIVCLYGFWGWTPILLSGLFIKGMGLGAVMAVASIAMISGVPSHRAGMASSVEEVSYEFGSLTSIAVLGSLVTALYSALFVLPAGAPESAGESLHSAVHIAHSTEASWTEPLLAAAGTAYSHAFALVSGLVVVVLAAGSLYTARILRGVTVKLED